MYSETDAAWAGGFYSGEGSCSLTHNGQGRAYAQMAINNTHLPALERVQRVIGGRIYGPYKPKSPLARKTWWCLKLDGKAEVLAAMMILQPHLTEEKREQIQKVLAGVDTNPEIDRGAAWRTRKERYGTTGGNRPRQREAKPCNKRGHPVEEQYEYTDPKGRTMWKCRACQRETDRGRKR